MGLSIKLLPAVVNGEKGTTSRTRGVGGQNGATDGMRGGHKLPGDMPELRELNASGPGPIESLAEPAQESIERRPGPARRIRRAYAENTDDGALNAQNIKGAI